MSQELTIDKFEFVPGRVVAAMQYIEHCRWLTDPINFCGVSQPQGRALTPAEEGTYNAALEAMRLYFAGEMDFGGAPARLPEKREKKKRCKCGRSEEGED